MLAVDETVQWVGGQLEGKEEVRDIGMDEQESEKAWVKEEGNWVEAAERAKKKNKSGLDKGEKCKER